MVGKSWIATDTIEILHSTLGGQAIVIPAHRIINFFAEHSLISGNQVSVGVAENVPYVKRARNSWWRGIYGVDSCFVCGFVEAISTTCFPVGTPLGLEPFDPNFVRG